MKFCFHNSLLHANEEFLYEWKVIVPNGLCSRVSLLSHLSEATFAWITRCFPIGLHCWCHQQYFFQQKDFTTLFYILFQFCCWFCLGFGWLLAWSFKLGKGQRSGILPFFFFLTCGSLPHTLLIAKWISGEEMQLPPCCTRSKSGRGFRVSHFVQTLTLPSQLHYDQVREGCCSFCGLAKANYSYQWTTCFGQHFL